MGDFNATHHYAPVTVFDEDRAARRIQLGVELLQVGFAAAAVEFPRIEVVLSQGRDVTLDLLLAVAVEKTVVTADAVVSCEIQQQKARAATTGVLRSGKANDDDNNATPTTLPTTSIRA